MKILKIATAFLVAAIMVFSLAEPVFAATANEKRLSGYEGGMGAIAAAPEGERMLPQYYDDIFIPASDAYRALVSGAQPATFTNVSYEFVDGVVIIDSSKDESQMEAVQGIATAGMLKEDDLNTELTVDPNRIVAAGAFIDKEVLDEAVDEPIEDGTVVLDIGTGTAFAVVESTEFTGLYGIDSELKNTTAPLEDTYRVRTPQPYELLEDYVIPKQTVELNPANIKGFAPVAEEGGGSIEQYLKLVDENGMELTGGELGGFKYMHDIKYKFEFPDIPLNAFAGGSAMSSPVKVYVRGGMALGDFDLTARYSAFGGYEFGFTIGEEIYLVVTLQAEMEGDLKIPLFGFDVWLPGGNCALGIFIVVEVDGDIRIEMEANEYTRNFIGLGGKTFCYVPYTFGPLYRMEQFEIGGDMAVQGEINGRVKVGPMAELKIFGLDLVGAGAFIGLGLSAKVDSRDSDWLDVRLYCFFEIYVSMLGKRLDLLNEDITILKRKTRNMGKYKAVIDEAFVAPGRVGGRILHQPKNVDDPWDPIDGIEYRIRITGKDEKGNPRIIGKDINGKDQKELVFPLDGTWAKTKNGGEFYQGDGLGYDHGYDFGSYNIDEESFGIGDSGLPGLTRYDEVSVEFVGGTEANKEDKKTKDDPYKSLPVNPSLPFDNVTISEADYFNDYVVGHIDPQRLKDWTKAPIILSENPRKYSDEERCVWVTPPAGIIGVIEPAMLHTSWYDNGLINNPKNIWYDYRNFDEPEWGNPAWWTYGGGWYRTSGYNNGNLWRLGYDKIPYAEFNEGHFKTDAAGLIDTRIPFDDMSFYYPHVSNWIYGEDYWDQIVNPYFDVSDHTGPLKGGFHIKYKYRGCVVNLRKPFTNTTMSLQFQRAIFPVEGSYKKTVYGEGELDEHVVDSMQYDEYIWIINPNGTRTVQDDELLLTMMLKSSADADYPKTGSSESGLMGNFNLIRTVDGDTSTTLLSMRVTVEWNWAKHPDPARFDILTRDSTKTTRYGDWLTTAGGTLETNPIGLFPACYIEGAPQGVTIDRDTGVITVPPGLPLGKYTFKIKAVQEYRGADVDFNNIGSIDSGRNKYFLIPDEEFYVSVPAPADVLDFTLLIREAPPEIQPAEDTEHGYVFEVDRIGSGITQQIYTVAGDPPITWTLEDFNEFTPLPDFVSIDPSSGLLRINPNTGTEKELFEFMICAENSEGKDTRICSVFVFDSSEIIEVREAPVIIGTPGVNEMMNLNDFSGQFSASGSTPIYWSLEPASGQAVPPEASIDNSGRLYINGSIDVGNYSFIVKASNDVGYDQIQYSMKVVFNPIMNPKSYEKPPYGPSGPFAVPAFITSFGPSGSGSVAVLSSSSDSDVPSGSDDISEDAVSIEGTEDDRSLMGMAETQIASVESERIWESDEPLDFETIRNMTPLNEVTISWWDDRDAFVDERLTVNGAEFLFWDSIPEVIPADEPYLDPYYKYYEMEGYSEILSDEVLRVDRFHMISKSYERPEIPAPGERVYVEGFINQAYLASLYKNTNQMLEAPKFNLIPPSGEGGAMLNWIQNVGFAGMEISDPEEFAAKAARNEESLSTGQNLLVYGPQLIEMEEQKSGSYTVELGGVNGNSLPGEYFNTLSGLNSMSLVIEMDGLTVTFDGKDVKYDEMLDAGVLDFEYFPDVKDQPDTAAKTMMLESADMSGGETYAYNFRRPGELPATGTFAVTTNIKEGSQVKLYRYEGDIDNFTLQKDNLIVGEGGVVTYRSSTLGYYLITTNTIERALTESSPVNLLLIIIIVAAAAAAVAGIFIYRRKKRVTPGIIVAALLCVSLSFTPLVLSACSGAKDVPLDGKYVISEITDDPDGATFAELDKMYKAMNLELTDNVYIQFSESNRYKIVLFGRTVSEGIYENDKGSLALKDSGGQVSSADLSGKKVTWTYETGAKLTFEKK